MNSHFVRFALTAACSLVCALAQTPGRVDVINYSGFVGTFPIAPGSIASAYGAFGTVATTSASSLSPMPTELAGIGLFVNNVAAPLYFVSSAQINFVVPAATAAGRHAVEVRRGQTVVARGSVAVYDIGPGLASSDTSPTRQGIIQNQDFAINSQSAPARRGSVIQLYATGCGATQPATQDGRPPAALSPAVAATKAFVSWAEAPVLFAGAHPQFPGICQVNITVPSNAFISGQVPVFVTVNGVASNPVSFWVEQ
jgi:uncharacterized protein (TIGR03437 family)